jgi:hypoxanthine-DNA glycosylase
MPQVRARRKQQAPTAGDQPALAGLPPILGSSPRVLILGSMPGAESLRMQQYYAHSRNAFWPILCDWLGLAPETPYASRCKALTAAGLALWDVLGRCHREGSLDSAIDLARAQLNDFPTLFAAHPGVQRVGCNGATAHRLFVQRAMPTLPIRSHELQILKLPSTSPAHAGMRYAEKLARWREGLDK